MPLAIMNYEFPLVPCLVMAVCVDGCGCGLLWAGGKAWGDFVIRRKIDLSYPTRHGLFISYLRRPSYRFQNRQGIAPTHRILGSQVRAVLELVVWQVAVWDV